MMKRANGIAIAATVLLGLSIFWLINTRTMNQSLETGLRQQRIKSEKLLSEKLKAEKDLLAIKEQLAGLKGKNKQLDDLVKRTSAKVESQEALLKRLKKENTSITQLRKQREELLDIQSQLQRELSEIRTSYANLEAQNRTLNATVASLEEKNRILTNDMNRAMLASVDQTQVQALKRSEKLTVRARRTKKLIANFEVPVDLKNLSFRILKPNGEQLTQEQGSIAFTSAPADNNFTASLDAAQIGSGSQKVKMTFEPKVKLSKGTYGVEILNDNIYVASMKVDLK